MHFLAVAALGVFLYLVQDLDRVLLQLVYCECMRGVIGQGDHRLLGRQVDAYHGVIVGDIARLQHLEVGRTLVYLVVMLHLVVGDPYRAQACGLGGHDIDAIAEVDGQVLHARAGKLEHLVLYKSALEGGFHQRDGHIVRTYALAGTSLKPHQHYLGSIDVPGVVEQLLHELAAAFTHAHVTQRAVARVAVGAQYHVAAFHHFLAGKLVDHSLVGGHIDATVLLGRRQAENVVVFVDGSAHSTQRVVAVGHCIGQWEFFKTACAGRLNDAHIGDVVRHHGIKLDSHPLAFAVVDVMGTQNAIGDGVFTSFIGTWHASGILPDLGTMEQVHSLLDKIYHVGFSKIS